MTGRLVPVYLQPLLVAPVEVVVHSAGHQALIEAQGNHAPVLLHCDIYQRAVAAAPVQACYQSQEILVALLVVLELLVRVQSRRM